MLTNFFYSSPLLNKFVNKFIKSGKKEKFEILLYNLFIKLSKSLKLPVFFLFFEAVEKQKPLLGLKNYLKTKQKKKIYVPAILHVRQQYHIAVQFVVKSVVHSMEAGLEKKILSTFLNYFNKSKILLLKGMLLKQEMYQLAIKNKPVKHYRWGAQKASLKTIKRRQKDYLNLWRNLNQPLKNLQFRGKYKRSWRSRVPGGIQKNKKSSFLRNFIVQRYVY